MTYPPQGPANPYQHAAYQASGRQVVPERPSQVLTAAVLMFAIGFIGVLMMISLVSDAGHMSSQSVGPAFAGCLGPMLHIAVGVLAVFVLRGQHGPRVAVFCVAGAAALCDGFSVISSATVSSQLSDYAYNYSLGPGYFAILAIVTGLVLIANVVIVIMLATGRAAAWFAAVRAAKTAYPAQNYPTQWS
ncbi:hypothetical protein AB0I28_28265 [Phytomonospora sp. NPDC050363]|uniref:hypothetical protein n=1 Tax=Phytomonospora sp. NPDC050363 TaxID=3155642 RepID=UPI0033FAEE39